MGLQGATDLWNVRATGSNTHLYWSYMELHILYGGTTISYRLLYGAMQFGMELKGATDFSLGLHGATHILYLSYTLLYWGGWELHTFVCRLHGSTHIFVTERPTLYGGYWELHTFVCGLQGAVHYTDSRTWATRN